MLVWTHVPASLKFIALGESLTFAVVNFFYLSDFYERTKLQAHVTLLVFSYEYVVFQFLLYKKAPNNAFQLGG